MANTAFSPRVGLYTRRKAAQAAAPTNPTPKARVNAWIIANGRRFYVVTATAVTPAEMAYCNTYNRLPAGQLPNLYPAALDDLNAERARVLNACRAVDDWDEMTSAQLQDIYNRQTYPQAYCDYDTATDTANN